MKNYKKLRELYSYYSPVVRFQCHLFMWLVFSALLFLQYYISLNFSLFQSFFLAFRVFVSSAIVFYLFFYLFMPIVKRSKFFFFFIFFAPFSIILWIIINHSFYEFAYLMNWDLSQLYIRLGLGVNYSPDFSKVFSVSYILLNSLSVIYSLSPFFFIKIIFDVLKMYIDNVTTQIEYSRLEIEKVNIEKQFLLMQLNPHFLFNSLNNIYGLIITKNENAGNLLLNLSRILEYTLYEFNEEKVPLQKEIDFIKNYFNIQKVRYPPDSNIKLVIDDSNQYAKELQISPLITFVFLENAFKYGLKVNEKGFISVHIVVKDDSFVFEIINDVSLRSTKHDKKSGIGLVNIKKRLELLYKDNYQLVINEEEDIYSVNSVINLK